MRSGKKKRNEEGQVSLGRLLCFELQKECEVKKTAEGRRREKRKSRYSQEGMTFLEQKSKAAEDTGSNGKQTVSLTELEGSGSTRLAAAATSLCSTAAATETAEDGLAGRVCGLSGDGTGL
jgi:hypothetical protein